MKAFRKAFRVVACRTGTGISGRASFAISGPGGDRKRAGAVMPGERGECSRRLGMRLRPARGHRPSQCLDGMAPRLLADRPMENQ